MSRRMIIEPVSRDPDVVRDVRKLAREGMSRTDIALLYGISRHTVQAILGTSEVRGREEISIWANRSLYDKAVDLIRDHLGLTIERGRTRGEGSAGALLEAIGDGRVVCQFVTGIHDERNTHP